MDALNDETLFVGTAEAEHVEMYLKAIWHIKEKGGEVKISTIAKMLNVRQPSVVQMLKKLNEKNLVNYNKAGVVLTEEGEKVGASMMRNSRLLEVLMDSALKVEIDEEMVCGIEHHMNKMRCVQC
jgi:DtxR family Mn-dependent transcriptional regulator